MAAGDSIVSICNIALRALGEDRVTAVFPPENNKRSIVCNEQYNNVRQAVLRSMRPNCAKKRGALSANTTPPAFGFSAAYPLPSDCLGVVDVYEHGFEDFVIEGNQILTSMGAPLPVLYVFDLTDPTAMDPLLVRTIGLALAEEIAPALVNSDSKQAQVAKRGAAKKDDARLISSQENAPKEWDDDVWLASRA